MGRFKVQSRGGDPFLGGLCFITDRYSCELTPVEMALFVLKAGVRWIQYRDKDRDRINFYHTAMRLRELTRDFGACFIVNDYADIAAAVDADGVHVGQDDLPLREVRKIIGADKLVGISTHSVEEAVEAQYGGADYIGFGPVYETMTKKEAGEPRGPEKLAEIRARVNIPVVAIGGIQRDCLKDIFSSGARAVAVASALLRGRDICCETQEFISAIRECSV